MSDHTIPRNTVSLQTPPGRGGIAVISLAGLEADDILTAVFRPWKTHDDAGRRPAAGGRGVLQLGRLVDGDRTIDEVIVHRTATGIEINIHGGPQVATAVLELLSRHGANIAPAPEANPQSFLLSHPKWRNPAIGTEMLWALCSARSVLAASALTQQWSVGISQLARTLLSAEPRPQGASDSCRAAAGRLGLMTRLLKPPEVVLAGPPNVGKSTLANAMVGRAVSVVHCRPGTTRDWVRELALLEGVAVWLTDTAGLWDPPTTRRDVDAEAVRRAQACAGGADLVLLLDDGRSIDPPPWLHPRKILRIRSKCDVGRKGSDVDVAVSGRTGQGLDLLRTAVREALGMNGIDPTEASAFTSRQAALLEEAAEALQRPDAAGTSKALRDLLEQEL